ncbi:MAG TPA: hypothetical protein P5531_01620 [Bacteroidales bacterium]|nr:hypothetical protein [Bacteroidales bacterium]HSA42354.1 hypothetical protein [Bacteroidales bacterium]
MSKKTIIITWRFNPTEGNPYFEKVPISTDYEIIKFYTPDQRNTEISQDAFDELVKIISEISSDLFVFIHSPNFKRYQNDLIELSKPAKNIHINYFEGSGYIYEIFINQGTYELKQLNADSFDQIYKQIEKKYGTKAKLNLVLMFLHQCLGGLPALPSEFDACKNEYQEWKENSSMENLRKLRNLLLKEAGITGEN